VKIKMGPRVWWKYTDKGKPNYVIVVFLTIVSLRIQVFWDVMLHLGVSVSK
jgi:hypothetical protein